MRNIILSIIVITLLLLSCKKEILYTLNVSVTPSGSGTTSITSATYQAGQSVSITATPAPEYIFKGWSGSSNSDNNPLTVVMDSTKSLVANFEKRQYPLSLTIEGSGVVKEEIVLTQAKVGSYPSGTTVKLTAIPDTGWKFDSWSGDTSLTVNPITINFKKPFSIKSKFVEEPIKFITNLDTGMYYVEDILPLQINLISGKLKTGYTVSIETIFKDSSKPIFKIDTSFGNGPIISLKIPGHKNVGNYKVNIRIKSKGDTTNVSSNTINFSNIPILPAIRQDKIPDLNWNDVTEYKSGPYDFNGDNIPDAISHSSISNNSILPNIFFIYDFTGKELYRFNLKDFKPDVRDSLNNLKFDFEDLNDDSKKDIVLSYMGEWSITKSDGSKMMRYFGINTFILINKGNMKFEVTEIIDEPNNMQFGVALKDWDFDGKIDILPGAMQDGIYFKNLGNNKFEKRSITPLFISNMYIKDRDFDSDKKNDYFNFWINQKDEFGNWINNNKSQTLTIVTSSEAKNYSVTGKEIEKYIFIIDNITTAERISMVDGDGDKDLDLIVGSLKVENKNWTYIQEYFENTGTSFVYKPNFIELDKNLRGELQVWTQDIDKDGLMDLYYPTYNTDELSKGKLFWWKNTKNGFKIMKVFRLIY